MNDTIHSCSHLCERPACVARRAERLRAFLERQGYTRLRTVNSRMCGIQKMAYTYGLIFDLMFDGYEGRYCYENEADAIKALAEWTGEGHPGGPWIKLKGLGLDMLNPELVND